jgi:hypothetical protein
VSFFFKFLWDECKSGPRIDLKRVNPWHLSIVRPKARMMGICSIKIVKFQFGSLMNTSHSNIRWMLIILAKIQDLKLGHGQEIL